MSGKSSQSVQWLRSYGQKTEEMGKIENVKNFVCQHYSSKLGQCQQLTTTWANRANVSGENRPIDVLKFVFVVEISANKCATDFISLTPENLDFGLLLKTDRIDPTHFWHGYRAGIALSNESLVKQIG